MGRGRTSSGNNTGDEAAQYRKHEGNCNGVPGEAERCLYLGCECVEPGKENGSDCRDQDKANYQTAQAAGKTQGKCLEQEDFSYVSPSCSKCYCMLLVSFRVLDLNLDLGICQLR